MPDKALRKRGQQKEKPAAETENQTITAAGIKEATKMTYTTTRDVLRKSTYIPQTILTMCINFGINFGIAWATFSNWGKRGHDYDTWPRVGVWKWSYDANSCIAFDLFLTVFLMAFFCTLLGSGGAQKDVKEKKCEAMEPSVIQQGWWRFTPVRFRNLCVRSFAQGVFFCTLIYPVVILILTVAIRDGTMSGLGYVIFKGIFAFFLAWPVFTIVYFAAIDRRNFPELEFESLMRLTGAKEGGQVADWPPMVGQVGHV